MVGYTVIEQAVRDRIRDHFGNLLTDDSCVIADLDTLFNEIVNADRDYGCIVDFAEGARERGAPFTKQMWKWRIGGFMLIRHKGDARSTDQQARIVFDKLYSLFEGDHTLNGITPFVRIEGIEQPDAGDLNDIPFYWIYFVIEALDK